MSAGLADRLTVVLGDGAPWIWNLAAELFPQRVEILDCYHADEHVSAAAGCSAAFTPIKKQLDAP